jgi:hypothetical protein
MLENVDRWLEQWRKPVWEALYRRDEESCRHELAQAIAGWEMYAATTDERQAARLYLDFLQCQADESFQAARDLKRGIVLEAIEQLANPVDSTVARTMQARVLLTLRSWAHILSVYPLQRAEVDRLFAQIPAEDLDHQCVSYLAFWSFAIREAHYLQIAYRYFVTQSVDFMVDYSRQRVKVMLVLTEGRCERDDLVKLIELAPHLMHAQWIGRHVAAFCMDSELWDDGLQGLLATRVTELRDKPPQVPPRSEPEGFVINL